MVTECMGPLAEQSFRGGEISPAQHHSEGRFADYVYPEPLVQRSLRDAVKECQMIDTVQYYTRNKERKIVECRSRPSKEVRALIRGLNRNITKRFRQSQARLYPSMTTYDPNVHTERRVEESDDHNSPHRSSDNSDASSHSSDSKRKRPDGEDSTPSPKLRRQRSYSSQTVGSETPKSSPSREVSLDVQLAPTMGLLRIGDEDAVHEFIVRRFKDLQQNLCKAIAKPWIKMINPNKQTANPYAGGSARAPWWWPQRPPAGTVPTLKNGFVRHKEPDHLKIQERLILLPHILYLVIDPPPGDKAKEIRKITLKEFKRMTFEQLSDKLNESNRDKKQLLDEIFGAAFQLQRYKRGLIDGGFKFRVWNRSRTRRGGSIEDYSDIKSDSDDVDEDDEEEFRQESTFPIADTRPVISQDSDDQMQHGLPDRAFDMNASRPTLSLRDLPIPSFHPQVTTNELSYGPSYNPGQMDNQDAYPSRTSGGYPAGHTLQEPPRRYLAAPPPPPHWFLGGSQYMPNAPVNSQLMNNQSLHGFSSNVNIPMPQSGVYLPSLSQPTMCMPQQEGFNENHEASRVCEGSRSMTKDNDERGDTLRLPHRPHLFPEYLHNLAFAANMAKPDSGGN